MDRRGFLGRLVAAPAIILTPGLLMPVRSIVRPPPLLPMEIGRVDGFRFVIHREMMTRAELEALARRRGDMIQYGVLRDGVLPSNADWMAK